MRTESDKAVSWRIAVLADTHDHYPPDLPGRLRAADEIWHLGDVCSPSVLAAFEQLGLPLRVVLGNCDWHSGWPRELRVRHGGMRFLLVHAPPARTPRETDVVLHGHTHRPRDETDPHGVRWLNPGCISRPRSGVPPSFAWLDIRSDRLDWRIVPL
ncbi:MAG: metallophosphoesterase family protein [Opitutaceae bacterium]|nr:metallophosphoesterase family protein [Opitutaceae bacterium]